MKKLHPSEKGDTDLYSVAAAKRFAERCSNYFSSQVKTKEEARALLHKLGYTTANGEIHPNYR